MKVPEKGSRYGRWIVLGWNRVGKKKRICCECQCNCGTIKHVDYWTLRKGLSKSCGCLKVDLMLQRGREADAKRGNCEVCRKKLPRGHRRYCSHECRCKNRVPIPWSYQTSIKQGAKKRGFSYCISEKFLWKLYQNQQGRCVLSGVEIGFAPYGHWLDFTASLDRIDSSKGYTKKNVQWIHKDLNRMKGKLSDEEFIEWCRCVAVHNNRSKKTGE